MRIACLAAAIYLGVVAVFYWLQTRLVFPGADSQGQSFAEVHPSPDTELVQLTTGGGVPVVALYGPALAPDGRPDAAADTRPSVIYFYGNAMCLSYATAEFDKLRRLGLNVLIPEYAGYGMSGGHPSESGCRDTAVAAYDYLVANRGASPKRIISAGWSLGGAVAIDLAARREVGGLIVFSTFTSAVELARRALPFVPVALLMRHRFESVDKLSRIRCPILIGHGRRDSIVPFQMGEQLAAKAGGPVETIWIDRASHNDFFDVGGNRIDQGVATFIEARIDRSANREIEL